ncbi:MAG TPA: hypothetical protein VMW36_01815 [Patescibacteria group bacterium]|nr:hypothetical protein [Patescibacteria group bacterium]
MITITVRRNKLPGSLLKEITKDQVLDGISMDAKKFRKKFIHILSRWNQLSSIHPEQQGPFIDSHIERFRSWVSLAVPQDVTPAQGGAATNWTKNVLLNNPDIFYLFMIGSTNPNHGASKIASDIEMFFQMQNFIPDGFSKDLNSYKTFLELEKVIDETQPLYQVHQDKKIYLDAEEGKKVVVETDEWIVYVPTNKGAACELGKGTKWCTAAPGLDYYEQYHTEEDPLFIFVNKRYPERERYQFHYGTAQFMDIHDVPVNVPTLRELHNLLLNSGIQLPKSVGNLEISEGGNVSSKTFEESSLDPRVPDTESWYDFSNQHDYKLHRIGGPAFIKYNSRDVSEIQWRYYNHVVGTVELIEHEYEGPYAVKAMYRIDKAPEKNPTHYRPDDTFEVDLPLGTSRPVYEEVFNHPTFLKWKKVFEERLKRLDLKLPEISEQLVRSKGIVITLHESLLREISADDVLSGISADKKKFYRKFRNVFMQASSISGLSIDDAEPEKLESLLNTYFLSKFRDFVTGAIPKDASESQKGTAANWVKNFLLSNPNQFANYIQSTSENTDPNVWVGNEHLPRAAVRIARDLEKFFIVQDFIDTNKYSRDLNDYKGETALVELFSSVSIATEAYEKHQTAKDYKDSSKGMEAVTETDKWAVFIPRNKGAACELGKNTQWCTAAPGLDYYEQYHSDDDPLFVFVRKDKPEERYQFHYGTQQFMDKNDEQLPRDEVAILHKILVDSGYQLPKAAQDLFIANEDGTLSFHNRQDMSNVGDGGTGSESWSWADAPGEVLYDNDPDDILHRLDGPAKIIYHTWGYSAAKKSYSSFPQYRAWAYKGKIIGQVYTDSYPDYIEFKFREAKKSDVIVDVDLEGVDPDTAQDFMAIADKAPEYVSFVKKMEDTIKNLAFGSNLNEAKRLTISIGRRMFK